MRFMTWNVNGIRALVNYHPYCDDLHKNYNEILDYLGADIICLQETKITRSKLDSDLALVPGYNSYWSFHRTKSGYSGVVIYVKDHIKLLAAEEGISGVLSGNIAPPQPLAGSPQPISSPSGSVLNDKPPVGGYPAMETDDPVVYARLQELDNEGRGIVLDFGFFVLFNLYCPNETDETRLPFKMDYYSLLEARVRELMKEGRQVMVLGDMNVIPTELDHCDPAKWKKESNTSDFTDTPPRRWFNNLLAPQGPLTDLYRVFHKDEQGAFTCWNTKINARPSNYGTRLDYILVTEGLVPWFKSCDRMPHIVGSDHCPVVAEMSADLVLEKPVTVSVKEVENQDHHYQQGTNTSPPVKQRLQDILDHYGGSTDHALAAKFYDEFSGKQQKLSLFFRKHIKDTASTASFVATSEDQTTHQKEHKRRVKTENGIDDAPRKKLFFSADQTSTQMTSPESSASSSASSTPLHLPLPATSTLPTKSDNTKPSKVSSLRMSSQGRTPSKKAGGKPTGQRSVLSFFTNPKVKSEPSPSDNLSVTGVVSTTHDDTIIDTSSSVSSSHSQVSSDQPIVSSQCSALDTSSSQPSPSTEPTFSPNNFADWIPGSQDVLPFTINESSTTSKWQSLFSPRAVP
ncbi:Class II abasic (AP) endonuclease, partial [Podila humilis]